MKQQEHIPVLLNEAIEGLNIKEDGIYVDCTLGRGGHSSYILKQLKNPGHLFAFDQDQEAIEASSQLLSTISPHYTLIHDNFSRLKENMISQGIPLVNGILFDLGVSSPMFDQQDRGFSYRFDGPLDMRMDQRNPITAASLINSLSEKELADIFFKYSEERYSRRIAKQIFLVRKEKPILTTYELVDIIKSVVPAKYRAEQHPAKRVFQALRIAVNNELIVLEESLDQALDLLASGGRICVISFHSLEDRIVKNKFKEVSSPATWNRNMPLVVDEEKPKFKLITKKPITPSPQELEVNPRSHSAKLRIIEKI